MSQRRNLHVFNPYHDLALANFSPTFKAPDSALTMTHDLSLLPCWFANDGDIIVSDQKCEDIECDLMSKVKIIPRLASIHDSEMEVVPWGWDQCVMRYLEKCSVDHAILPTNEWITGLREMSHRAISVKGMKMLHERIGDKYLMPTPAVELRSVAEVKDFAAKHEEIVLKAPWSSSGKGIFWSKGTPTASIIGWCQRIIDKQGSVMGEIAYDRIRDFAMEFHCDKNGNVSFAGYSLFFTERAGIYHGNRLMSNEDIESELSRWITKENLEDIKNVWIDFLVENVAQNYIGYLGVDMFIYKTDDVFAVDPAVEVNLRMTMGMIARIFYDRYVEKGAKGWFRIDHLPQGAAIASHEDLKERYPLKIENQRVTKGYLSLCPVAHETVYMANIVIE